MLGEISGKGVEQSNLGGCYYSGKGVEQSDELAREWLTKAAAQGNEVAIKNFQILDEAEGKTTPTPHHPNLFFVPPVEHPKQPTAS